MVSNKSSSRLEDAKQIPRVALLARDSDAGRIVGSRLESAEEIPRIALLAPFAKCALGKRDADARGIVGSRLESVWTLRLSPVGNLPVPPLCLKPGRLLIRPFYNT